MEFPQRHTTNRQTRKLSRSISSTLPVIFLAVAISSLVLFAGRLRARAAQEAQLIQITEEQILTTGLTHHQPTNSLLLSSEGRTELLGPAGQRSFFSQLGSARAGRMTSAVESRYGFVAGEIFAAEESAGKITRISVDGTKTVIDLPGEIGSVSDLALDPTGLFGGDLIAVTTEGGVWRIDSLQNLQRAAPLVIAGVIDGGRAPVNFAAVMIAPNDPGKYGAWAGKIIAADRQKVYSIDLSGVVESFDLDVKGLSNVLQIREGENFYGAAYEPQTGRGSIWGMAAAAFAGMANDLLLVQTPDEDCRCAPALWRLTWNGGELNKTRLAEISGVENAARLVWGQATFSSFTAQSLQQQGQAIPLVGPFDRPAAEISPGINNDDFTLIEPLVQAANNATTTKQDVTFVNTLKNIGDAKGNFIVSAPTIPTGFTVSATFDKSKGFTSLNNGGTLVTSREADPNEQFNVEFLISAPAGTTVKTNFDVVIRVSSVSDATKFNLTIDRINFTPQAPPIPELTLTKSVKDLNGGQIVSGDVLEYSLTLSNPSNRAAGKAFIAEFLPPNTTYVANSVQIMSGANSGAKTDAIDSDQVDFLSAAGTHGQINIGVGAGAGGRESGDRLKGGTLAPGESSTATFQVRVNSGLAQGALIINGADWGADDIYPGGKSNVVTSAVSAPFPLLGPFGNPEAVGSTGNNDDFTLGKINFQISNGQTTEPGQVRFINTLKNAGAAPGRFVITAPAMPPGLSLKVSVDSGETFVSLGQGASAVIPTLVNPNETRNIDVRVTLEPGLGVGVDYDVVLQASREDAQAINNRTIDRVRPDPNPPMLKLVKAVRDITGRDLDGKTVLPGQTIEYALTLNNNPPAATVPVAKSFIAEYLPPGITYVPNSVRIILGPNEGPKTDKRGDDQVDYFPSGFVNGQINIFTGSGAGPDQGGVLAPGESTTILLRATVDQNAAVGTVIHNGADWGAEDFAVGGRSNVVTVTVGAQVCDPASISTQPASQTKFVGQSVTFSVIASGTDLKYQWRKGGAPISGATSSSFTIAATAFTDAGSYDVVVTSSCNSTTSSSAILTVNCPTITPGPATIAGGKVGDAYTQTFTQSGGAAPVSLSISVLPPGLSFNGSSGSLSGTPAQSGDYSFTITATDANGCTGAKNYTLTIEPDDGQACVAICFRSSNFFSLNFNQNAIPGGAVLIGGVNANNPISTADARVKQALDGRFGAVNREYVTAQLNVLNASGLGAGNVVSALASRLSCYGLDFTPVTVGNGAMTLTRENSLFDLFVYINSAVKGSISSRDACLLAKLLNGLNGNSSANVCHRQSGPIDFASCN